MSYPPSDLPSAAAWYAERGRPVFPLGVRSKIPLPGSRGFKDATCDAEQVRRWWDPKANLPGGAYNIGGAIPSGLVVVDVDGRDGYGELKAADRELPATATVESRPGHRHHFYSVDDDPPGQPDISPGVNTRTAGYGYTVLPPSVHPTGSVYRWVSDPLVVAPAPTWLAEHLNTYALTHRYPASAAAAAVAAEPLSIKDTVLVETICEFDPYVKRLYAGEWESLKRYPSQSEADYGLLSRLLSYMPDEPERVARLFKSSKLYRPKADSPRGDGDYVSHSINRLRSQA